MTTEDIDVSGDGGVLKRVVREGSGGVDDRPQSGDKVTVHYVGTLASDGSEFDSSRSRGDKFQFTLGQGQVIKAWDLGVATMRRGELATLTCKSEYAYGATGSPPKIPADATLVFEVELFDWQGEDLSSEADGGIIRRLLLKGTGFDTPNDGATVIVDLCGSLDGRVFDERTAVTFALGEGCDHQVCAGIEQALHKFKSGEQSQLTLAPQHAFGAEGHEAFQIPPNTTVQYRVTLTGFEKAKERWEFDTAGKLEQAKLYKDKGTTFFKAGKYQTAEKNYKKAVDFLDFETGWSDEEKPLARELELAGHLNLALCYIRLLDHPAARQHCDKALTVDADSVKGLFRRGQALLGLNEPQLAQADFRRCQQLDADNRAAAAQLLVCAKRIQAERQREKRMYSNLFERMSKLEEKEDPLKNGGELKIDHFPNSNGDATETAADATAVSESATNGSAGDVPEVVLG